MHRQLTYSGALIPNATLLGAEKATMVALGYAAQSALGTATCLDGLACTATTPVADMHVTVGTGAIYSVQPVDSNAFGDLGTDTAHTVLKQGVLDDPASLLITAPATTGYSQVFLVQAAFSEVDAGSTVLNYYNAANPALPFSGPANSGTSQYTVRKGTCVIQLKAGTAAATGTQTAPSADAGYVALYTVTVANGATAITSGNIARVPGAPFVDTKLPQVPAGVQSGKWLYGVTGGTANALTVTLNPIPSAYVAGMAARVKVTNTNTGPATINVNGLGAAPIVRADGSALKKGDLVAGQLAELGYDGTSFQVVNVSSKSLPLSTVTILTTPGAWSFTATVSGMHKFTCWSGGGGGGGSYNIGGGAGGNGGARGKLSVFLNAGDTCSGVIGAGGAAGAAALAGGTGGTTSFSGGGRTASLTGGGGGNPSSSGGSTGAPSGATGWDDGLPGFGGQYGYDNGSNLAQGGSGGAAPESGPCFQPACTSSSAITGNGGAAPGGGGGGGSSISGAGVPGGAGGRGQINIESP